ncbi:hypothetical protein ACFQ0M_47790 [Kitasatospora aburaviensis]|uniref:Uncharacterized protein n=1 Tax=Kitasatospora aburaviensis TaxID=67265 RepID=A0ABW1EYL1_9ACTN
MKAGGRRRARHTLGAHRRRTWRALDARHIAESEAEGEEFDALLEEAARNTVARELAVVLPPILERLNRVIAVAEAVVRGGHGPPQRRHRGRGHGPPYQPT